MSLSIWRDEVTMPQFDSLQKDTKTDVLIIGGGICGILCAYFLKQLGVNYLLVEANTIGSGITKNTTAKITSLHGLIYHQLINNAGKEKAKMYLDANNLALEKFRSLSEGIDCDFETTSAYTYSLNDRNKIEREVHAVNSLGYPADYVKPLPLPFQTEGAIRFTNQAQFQPMKFLAAISKDSNIYEHTFIKEIQKNEAFSEHQKITADKIIVASHYPFIDRRGNYYLKIYQHRSYVIALENCENVHGMYVDEAKKGLSFRNYKDLLLLGGGSHRTGKHGGKFRNANDKTLPTSGLRSKAESRRTFLGLSLPWLSI